MDETLFILALVAYLVVAVAGFLGAERWPFWLGQVRLPSLLGGAVLHLAGLGALMMETGRLPVHTPGASLASLGLLVIGAHLLVRRAPRMESLGGLFVPLAVVLLALSQVLPTDMRPSEVSTPGGFWFPIHASMTFLGLVGLTVSFGVSVYYLLVRSRLKSKRLEGLERLPSLDALDRINTRAMLFGFSALALGIASGGIWGATRSSAALDATGWVTIAVWLWYGVALQIRVVAGWRGRLAALASVAGFAGLVLSMVAVNVAFQGWHG